MHPYNKTVGIVQELLTWFIEIAFVQEVGMHVCTCAHAPRELVTIHVKSTHNNQLN